MSVKLIVGVETSKDGKRTYAVDQKGNPMFGRTPAITALLKTGAFANVVEQHQTKTYNASGELVDLPIEEQRTLQIITGVFPDRITAIKMNAEEELFEQETKLYVASETNKLKETYKVEGSLAGAV